MANETNPESTTDPENAEGTSVTEEPSSEATVDLADEAGQAAASPVNETTASKGKTRSLDALALDEETRKTVEAHVNRAINDAVRKHDQRKERQLKEEGYLSRDQVEAMLVERDAAANRRAEARDRMLNVLGEAGITPGSEAYRKVHDTYRDGVEQGNFTPQILLTDAGIKTLVAISGVAPPSSAPSGAGAQAGLPAVPDGAVRSNDGTIQLNARNTDKPSLAEQTRLALAAQQRKSS